jgi:GNAT superfamily N-acetyltransferase
MRPLLVSHQMFESDPERFDHLVASTRGHLIHLSSFYPSFADWYDHKVVPGLRHGDRTLALRFIDGRLGGIAITKDDGLEKKLCCLRVLPHWNGSGLGLRLFDDAFDVLGTEKPLLSVSDEQLLKFHRIFDHFGFVHAKRYEDLYRVGCVEHSYNGQLVSGARALKRAGRREELPWTTHSQEFL